MKRKNTTRNALITSILSVLMCVSMLVGTTFAWFTDEVVTGMNTIAAGNLDVELLADGTKVTSGTLLFDDVELWEPGVVVYENLQVANVGNLALEYQMTLNFGDENDLNGHKLSEVLKVAVLDTPIEAGTDRATVLAAAKEAVDKEVGDGRLNNFCVNGELEPGTESAEQAVVIFWAPNENAKDNLYNANNGQVTSDGQPLHISFGINLQATQMMYEDDSFGTDYDMNVDNTPFASIVPMGETPIKATYGIGGTAHDIYLDTSYQFEPTLTDTEVAESAYRYWHADFVVSADKDVPADTMALAGYYDAWCKLNNDYWVALINDGTAISAGQEIRLVELLGATVNYEEICTYGNDGIGFQCGAVDLTGINAGTTITVELRLYETEEPSEANGNSHNVETGNFITIATAKYTFGINTAEKLKAQLEAGNDVTLGADIDAGTVATLASIPADAQVVLDLNGHSITATLDNDGWSQLFRVNKGATFTVEGEGNVHVVADQTLSYGSVIFNNDAGNLIIDGGTYTMDYGTYAEGYLLPTIVDTNSNVGKATTTINGGTFYHNRNMFRNFAQPQRGANNATLIINGGIFNGEADDYAAIWNQKTNDTGVVGDGVVILNGGTFNYIQIDNDFADNSCITIDPSITNVVINN